MDDTIKQLFENIEKIINLTAQEKEMLDLINLDSYDDKNGKLIFNISLKKVLSFDLVDKLYEIKIDDNQIIHFFINQVESISNDDYFSLINHLDKNHKQCFKNIKHKIIHDCVNKCLDITDLTNLELKIFEKNVHFVKDGFKKYFGINIDFNTKKKTSESINSKQIRANEDNELNYDDNNQLIKKQSKFITTKKVNNHDIVCLNSISREMNSINVIGEIFHIDIKSTPKMDSIIFYINDYEGTYLIKWVDFNKSNPITFEELKNKFHINDWVMAKISIKKDNFENLEYGHIHTIDLINKPSEYCRVDNCEQKRIELMVHTKMSAFDGINNVKDVFQLIKDLNMSTVGFCDRYDIQSFPEIQKCAKEFNIKPLYGCELEVLDDNCICVLNATDQAISEPIYVVFDLETTGLYPAVDDIIEFGAIKLKNNQIIDRCQFFIKPNKPIPKKIVEITKITNDMVSEAINQSEAIKKIIDYIDDCVLIAHNGIGFDFSFLVKKAEIYLNKSLNNVVIDTLPIARALFPTWKTHRLEKLCTELSITYLKDDAHRADYDAEVLFLCWNKIVDLLNQKNITKLNEINQLSSETMIAKYTSDMVNIYAKTNDSLKVINELVSISLTDNLIQKPIIYRNELIKKREQIIITNSPIDGEIFRIALYNTVNELKTAIKFYDCIFICAPSDLVHLTKNEDLTLEELENITKQIITIAKQLNKKVIAVSNSYYLNPWDKQFQYVYLYAKSLGGQRHRYYRYRELPTSFIKTTQEMLNAFSFLDDQHLIKEIVIDNTHWFNHQIDDNIFPIKDKLFTPNMENVDNLIQQKVYETAKLKYGENLPYLVTERLKKELDSIISNHYSVIYWISHLLVKKSNNEGYVVGSRGSVGSSLVATMLNITDVNPLTPHYICSHCHYFQIVDTVDDGFDLKPIKCPKCKQLMYGDGHNIPFETFLGFKCDKVPDIDLNFSGLYQAKAHEFIREIFGKERAFRAGTISTIATKTSYGYVKAYFEEINQIDVDKTTLSLYAKKCEDVKRTTGQHPGGILVVPNEYTIFDFSPYNFPADDTSSDWYTTHYAFEYLHDNLLKFDILGHDNPTILKMLKDLTNVDEKDIPNYDENVMQLFTSTKPLKFIDKDYNNEKNGCITIPEFGTKFVREMLNDTQPKTFSDLIRISGLSHGTNVYIDNAKSLIKSNGILLKNTIACRDDIMIFLISKGIENSIAFKIMEDVRKGKGLKSEYIKIMKEHGVEQWYIDSCNKIAYIFPKAHATAYVIHAWKFAWYKIYYPLEYYATFLSIKTEAFDIPTICDGVNEIMSKRDDIQRRLNNKVTASGVKKKETDLLVIYEIALEIYGRGFKIVKPNINTSLANEFIIENQALVVPFSCIDGIGYDVAVSIINARKEKPFSSINDLLKRTKINKTSIEILKKLGALNSLPESDQLKLFDL